MTFKMAGRNLYPIQALEEVEEPMDTLKLQEMPPMERTWIGYCEESSSDEDGDEYETVEPPEEEDAFDHLLRRFAREPKSLLQLISTLRDHGKALHEHSLEMRSDNEQLMARIISLEKSMAVLQSHNVAMAKDIQVYKERIKKMEDTTIPRTYKLETAMAHIVRSNMQQAQKALSIEDQKLQELKQQIISTYTPELLCQAVKNEESELSPGDQLIHLAKRSERLTHIQETYDPRSNFWLDPRPLDPKFIDSLKSLTAEEQQEKIKLFWQTIVRIYNEDHVLCTMFEIENILLSHRTYGEKKIKLTELLLNGQKLQEALKKSKKTTLLRGMSFRKKDKISKSEWNLSHIKE